jgi:hypothetical protein
VPVIANPVFADQTYPVFNLLPNEPLKRTQANIYNQFYKLPEQVMPGPEEGGVVVKGS